MFTESLSSGGFTRHNIVLSLHDALTYGLKIKNEVRKGLCRTGGYASHH
jgi:hypothetical protein